MGAVGADVLTVPIRNARTASLLLLAVAAFGCSEDVDPDASLAEVGVTDDDRRAFNEEFEGILTDAEATCVGDVLFADTDIAVGDILEFADSPAPSGPVFDLYTSAFTTCIDPTATLPVQAAEGELRDGVVAGLRTAIPDLTDEQGDCLIQALVSGGVGARELVIAGYLPERAAALEPAMVNAAQFCLAPG